jgi:hypothetical protein
MVFVIKQVVVIRRWTLAQVWLYRQKSESTKTSFDDVRWKWWSTAFNFVDERTLLSPNKSFRSTNVASMEELTSLSNAEERKNRRFIKLRTFPGSEKSVHNYFLMISCSFNNLQSISSPFNEQHLRRYSFAKKLQSQTVIRVTAKITYVLKV